MKKLALLAAVSAVLAASVAHAATPSGPGKPTVTLNFFDRSTNFAATISQNQRPKLGDRFYTQDDVYKWNGTKRGALVGQARITFVVLTENVAQVSAVAHLPGGTLAVEGQTSFSARVNTLPVIGGTGRYATARGELTARSLGGPNSNRTAITIRLWM